VGSYFGIESISKRSQCNGICGANSTIWQDALTAGDASTVSFVVGGVLLAAGTVLWFTAPSDTSRP
jgi:hypothetical protein